MKIRKATIKDLKTIIDLNHALFKEDAGTRDPFTNLNWPREEGEKHLTKRIRDDNEELADVLIYCLALADRLNIDVSEAITAKLGKNRKKYPKDNLQPIS